jgi:hypothetical protein
MGLQCSLQPLPRPPTRRALLGAAHSPAASFFPVLAGIAVYLWLMCKCDIAQRSLLDRPGVQ